MIKFNVFYGIHIRYIEDLGGTNHVVLRTIFRNYPSETAIENAVDEWFAKSKKLFEDGKIICKVEKILKISIVDFEIKG